MGADQGFLFGKRERPFPTPTFLNPAPGVPPPPGEAESIWPDLARFVPTSLGVLGPFGGEILGVGQGYYISFGGRTRFF